jgi:hypothetical protein
VVRVFLRPEDHNFYSECVEHATETALFVAQILQEASGVAAPRERGDKHKHQQPALGPLFVMQATRLLEDPLLRQTLAKMLMNCDECRTPCAAAHAAITSRTVKKAAIKRASMETVDEAGD